MVNSEALLSFTEISLNPKFSLENRVSYRFSILSTLYLRCISTVYTKKFGLSTALWRILSIVGRYEPIFPGVAAEHSTMEPDKVTRAVDRLVAMGYVLRSSDEADRRRVNLGLTARGRAVYEDIEEISQHVDSQWRTALSAQENKLLDVLMEKLDIHGRALFKENIDAFQAAASQKPRLRTNKTKLATAAVSPEKRPVARKSPRAKPPSR